MLESTSATFPGFRLISYWKRLVTYSRQVNPAMQRLAPLLPGFFEPPQLFQRKRP